jgi:hypothetical protein
VGACDLLKKDMLMCRDRLSISLSSAPLGMVDGAADICEKCCSGFYFLCVAVARCCCVFFVCYRIFFWRDGGTCEVIVLCVFSLSILMLLFALGTLCTYMWFWFL